MKIKVITQQFDAIISQRKKQIRIPMPKNYEGLINCLDSDIITIQELDGDRAIQVKIVDSFYQKLTQITNREAIKEGVKRTNNLYLDYLDSIRYGNDYGCLSPILSFRSLWQLTHGIDSWKKNTITVVLCIEYK